MKTTAEQFLDDIAEAVEVPTIGAPRVPWVDLEAIARDGIPRPDYLVDGWLCRQDVALLVGAAGEGKTTTAYALGLALAAGSAFCGLPVSRPCRVLIVDEEQGVADSARTLIRLGAPHANLRLLSMAGVRLSHSDGRDLLRAAVEEFRPDVAILDSATQVFACLNENDAAQVADRFGFLFELRDEFALAFALIHHRGKEAPGQPRPGIEQARGSTVFSTQASTVWIARRISREALELSQVKRRGGELAPTLRIIYQAEPDGGPIRLAGEVIDEQDALDRLADGIVLYLETKGEAGTGDLVKAIPAGGASLSTHRKGVSRALAECVRLGIVTKLSRGRWTLSTPSKAPDEAC